ncbi:MAG: septation protein A [Nitrosomonadales bacterium]|jgi:intracellular septation protein|nr:septation protein A [Nitrosomonadales bacterium]MBT7120624.1 septation protein A [Nitrosomonadales bacterium]
MKFLYDLLPVILFFISFKVYDIFIATAVAIAVTLLQVFYDYFKNKKIDKMLLFNGSIITVLGGLTIILQDKTFIMWKPSVLYWLFAGILLISNLFFEKNLIKLAINQKIQLKEIYWNHLNNATGLFFIALGFINLYVAYNFKEDTWVNFKLFGITGILFIYIIFFTIYISKVSDK